MTKKVLLIIMDGYGEGKDSPYNAVTRAKCPFIKKVRANFPSVKLQCTGTAVGLPKGSMGGSEVGHFTIGAGRVVFQSLQEINNSIDDGSFFKMPPLIKMAEMCRKKERKLHFIGMISDEGIHAHINHLFALLRFAKEQKIDKVYIHAITDGRDVPEKSATIYLKKIEKACKKYGVGEIATIIGRYYAMDRDSNLSRTEKAFNLYTRGEGTRENSPIKAVENDYRRGAETDYYLNPILLNKKGLIEKEDGIVFFNYRSDRAIQLTEFFLKKGYRNFICFGPYSKKAPVLFPPNTVKDNLGETLAKKGLKQLRIAETEKYAHVTFFFNSQKKEKLPGEKSILIPSPKVPSYDLKPEMSAEAVSSAIIKELKKQKPYDFIVLNFANPDLVGHSGNFKAVKKSLEFLDQKLAQIIPTAQKAGYDIIFTADHGNSDEMRYTNGEPSPAHSFNPVIFILITNAGKKIKLRKDKNNGLKDIAPTILELMGIQKPKAMSGQSLIQK